MRLSSRLALFVLPVLAVATAAAGPTPKPRTATGRVTDVQGRPVAGATIDVSVTNQQYQSETIGEGVSDAYGRFALTLTTGAYGDLGLGVERPFEHWGWAGFPRGIVDEEVVLRRPIDRRFLDDLRAVRDPAERSSRVLEIAASDDLPEIEEMFPYLGELRPELVAIVKASTAEPKVRRNGSSPADHASRLLAYWADPGDDALLEPWIKASWGGRPANVAHLGLSAASIQEACDRWREIHFADQGISGPPPWNECRQAVLDSTGTHAVALFMVRYAYWGYSMHLVMRREGERWVLRGVSEGTIYHYEH